MIIDWNKITLPKGTVFHFKNSLRPFVEVDSNGDYCFLDINEMKLYSFEDLEYEGVEFYKDEADDDFLGVKVDGKIEWVE